MENKEQCLDSYTYPPNDIQPLSSKVAMRGSTTYMN